MGSFPTIGFWSLVLFTSSVIFLTSDNFRKAFAFSDVSQKCLKMIELSAEQQTRNLKKIKEEKKSFIHHASTLLLTSYKNSEVEIGMELSN